MSWLESEIFKMDNIVILIYGMPQHREFDGFIRNVAY